MYQALTFIHSTARWLVLFSLLCAIYSAATGLLRHRLFSKTDNLVRHATATIAHIQLVIGILFYTQSPIIKYFWQHSRTASHDLDNTFFGIIHITLMLIAIILITIGSAKTKRQAADTLKFRTMLVWYTAALIIIFIAIPWPFSPLAARPYFR